MGGIMTVLGKMPTVQSLAIDAGKLTPDAVSDQIHTKTEAIVTRPPKPSRPLNVILFGPPASGKGTQAAFLKKKYGLIHISTGQFFNFENALGLPSLSTYLTKQHLKKLY